MSLPQLPVRPVDDTTAIAALWDYCERLHRALEGGQPAGATAQALESGGLGFSGPSMSRLQLPDTDFGPPTMPFNPVAIGFLNQIGLSWTVIPDPTVIGYEVQRANDSDFTVNEMTLAVTPGLSLMDNNLDSSTRRYYRVRAVRPRTLAGDFNSDWSEVVFADTLDEGDIEGEMASITTFYHAVQRGHLTLVRPGQATTSGGLSISRSLNGFQSWSPPDSLEHVVLDAPDFRVSGGFVEINAFIAVAGPAGDALVARVYRDGVLISQSVLAGQSTLLPLSVLDEVPAPGFYDYSFRVIRTTGSAASGTQIANASGWLLEVRR